MDHSLFVRERSVFRNVWPIVSSTKMKRFEDCSVNKVDISNVPGATNALTDKFVF